ncbi:AMP deaminase [Dillenia turbinata]|uniref:AMP deaminase n=1 Tax=Dillenia turbinata TaxID=194707 RepID=A0AAN8UU76_9MAGN
MDSSSSASSSSASTLHLAMAAFFGASLMAISAFYIHKRSVDQLLHRLIQIRRSSSSSAGTAATTAAAAATATEDDDGGDSYFTETEFEGESTEIDEEEIDFRYERESIDQRVWQQRLSRSLDDNALSHYRISSSVPNVVLTKHWVRDDSNLIEPMRSDNHDFVPSNMPPLRIGKNDGENHSGPKMRAAVERLMIPRTIIGSMHEGADDSDEERTELTDGEDLFSYENRNALTDSVAMENKRSAGIDKGKTGLDLHGKGQADTASLQIGKNDLDLTNLIMPLRVALYGIFKFLTSVMVVDSIKSTNAEENEVKKMLRECLDLRESYVYRENIAPWTRATVAESSQSEMNGDPFHFHSSEATGHYFRMEDGVMRVYASKDDTVELFPVASSTTFFTDLHHILRIMAIGNVRTACHHRLRFLEEAMSCKTSLGILLHKFRLHLLVNSDNEFLAQKSAPHRDFYNVRKVDTHVHHSACMNQKHLLRFIKSKLRKEPDEVVIFRDGKYLTLREVFESLDLTGYDLNVDLLDVHADKSTFHRFDKFNLKYNPCGQSRLREIFLKQDNLIQGRFLAEVTKQVLSDLEASKDQMAEYRISIYGRKQSEWDQLASWFVNNGIYSKSAIWLIQLPRLYNIYKGMGIVTSFQNIIDNIFIPLFEVTVDPNSHPHLHLFLMQVVGFDLVDDESKPERRPTKHMPTPAEWTNEFNPAYSYYAYYCYANLYTLNKLRESKGLPTITLRPHCGEAGDVDHLAAGFLLCHNISHGINLRKSPVLQYLYYLAQIGLAMSPLSNNSLFLDYHRNPFPTFFQRGLNVSLSSDDPLQIHLTKEALLEEYSVASQVWKLSSCDLCEIARNSVYQSGFSHATKLRWLGGNFFIRGPEGNDIDKTNVPNLRIAFRHETWKEEMQYIYSGKARFPREIEP